jgi:magnesium-transporting ATPase (P-type)
MFQHDIAEIALLVAARKLGLDDCRQQWHRKREISFTSDTKWMAVHCHPKLTDDDDADSSGGTCFLLSDFIIFLLSKFLKEFLFFR